MLKTTAGLARLGLPLALAGVALEGILHLAALAGWIPRFDPTQPWGMVIGVLHAWPVAVAPAWALGVAKDARRVPFWTYLARLSWPIRALYLLVAILIVEGLGWAAVALTTPPFAQPDAALATWRFFTACFTALYLFSALIFARYRFGWGRAATEG
jgi:hypothetical protein